MGIGSSMQMDGIERRELHGKNCETAVSVSETEHRVSLEDVLINISELLCDFVFIETVGEILQKLMDHLGVHSVNSKLHFSSIAVVLYACGRKPTGSSPLRMAQELSGEVS